MRTSLWEKNIGVICGGAFYSVFFIESNIFWMDPIFTLLRMKFKINIYVRVLLKFGQKICVGIKSDLICRKI